MSDIACTVRGYPHPLMKLEGSARKVGAIPVVSLSHTRFTQWAEQFRLSQFQRFLSLTGANIGNTGSYPRARAICAPYDNAGVAFPGAGYVQIVAGAVMNQCGADSIVTLIPGVDVNASSARHWIMLTVLIGGLPPGTTGTITVSRTADWYSGTPTVTISTTNVDGANGMVQEFEIADIISAPDTSAGETTNNLFSLYITASWTGSAPVSAHAFYNPANVTTGPVVPTTVPGDFTARTESDWQRTYAIGLQRPGVNGPWNLINGGWSPHLGHFSREWSAINATYIPLNGRRPPRICFGMPEWIMEYNFSTAQQGNYSIGTLSAYNGLKVKPRAWIGNELKELAYWPNSLGLSALTAVNNLLVGGTVGSPVTPAAGYFTVGSGPGFRNVRVRVYNFSSSGGATFSALTIAIRCGGTVIGTLNFTGLTMTGNEGSYLDLASVYPASRDMAALLEFDVQVTLSGTPGDFANARITAYVSPRIDIPIPTHCVGPGPIEAPGGYYAPGIIDPPALGGVLHCAAGVSSQAWSIVVGAGNTQARLISFLPPTTGLWRIKAPNGGNVTIGPYEFIVWPANGSTDAFLSQAGKRFFGGGSGSTDAVFNGTWTLESAALTQKVIAASGTTIAGADLCPNANGYLFGTIAIPSAGTWLVWVNQTVNNNTGLEVAISDTDPYVTADITASAILLPKNWYAGSTANFPSLATPPSSPANGDDYWIVTPATGIWTGREGQIARYDQNYGWQYVTPGADDFFYATLDGVASYWDGSQWLAVAGSKMIQLKITTTGAQTVYVRAQAYDPCRSDSTASIKPGGTLTIGWEAA